MSLPGQSAKSREECEIFKKLKERHAVVFKTSCSSQIQIEKNDPSSLAKLRESLEKAITAYLHDNAQQIHSIIPYHYEKQIAIVIYTYNPAPDLIYQEWPQIFLGFPVFIVNLMRGYAVEPAVIPDSCPAILSQQREVYNKIKDKITEKLAEKHLNLSSVSVDYKIKDNKPVKDKVCLQIGVLTKGIVPLGEDMISPEIDGIPVDIVEVSATLCVQPMIQSLWPVKLGVGIGVEGYKDSTGTLGAVVKRNNSSELFLLSNAHVLCRKGIESAAIVHPSQQDYKELQNETERIKASYDEELKVLRSKMQDRRHVGGDCGRLERKLKERIEDWRSTKKQMQKNLEKQPRKIGNFTSSSENVIWENNYKYPASPPQTYGIDAAIASIEKDEFDSPEMFEMYEWPNDLKDDDGKCVSKISLNGDFMKEGDVKAALKGSGDDLVVYKCGRTTGVTRGTLYKEINVRLGCDKESIYVPISKDQGADFTTEGVSTSTSELKNKMWYNVLHIKSATVRKSGVGSDFCGDGDSGAIVFDEDGKCVGLLFGRIDSALSNMGGGLATPIHVVFKALNITLANAR